MDFPFLTALAAKATVLSLAAILCLLCLRRSMASTRHLVCASLFAALLALPVLMLAVPAWVPEKSVPLWFQTISTHRPPAPLHASPFSWQQVAMAVWTAGILFSLARIALGFVLLNLQLRRGEPLFDTNWQSDLDDIAGKLGVNPHFIRISLSGLNSPITFGFRNPVILLPREARQWDALSRQTVLLHELAHIRRGDWLSNCLAQVVLAVFWFHPLVWPLYGELRRNEEMACDDTALGHGVSPADYAGVLLEMTRNLPSRFLLATGILGKSGAHLRNRFTHILQRPQNSPADSRARGISLAFLLVVLAGCASLRTQQTQASVRTQQTQQVYQIGGDVSVPKILTRVQPAYSEAARKDKLQGTTVLGIVVRADGTPADVHVVSSLRPDLDANAIAAIQQWRFQPAVRQGVPVAVKANVEINFKLL